jgi:uncharacterized membrane protein
MFDKLFGLPAHPLLVHAPIVLLPIASIATVVLVAKPAWRRSLQVWWMAGVVLVFVLLFASKQSGEALLDGIESTSGEGAVLVDRHAQLADQTTLIAFVWMLVAVVLVGGEKWSQRSAVVVADDGSTTAAAPDSAVARGLVAVAAVLGVIATIWLIRTGHEGANSVWGTRVDFIFPD